MKYAIKSQLYSDAEAQLKGAAQVLDDCGPSSIAAAVAWASGYHLNPTASDGVAAKAKATGRTEKQGVSDNGSSLSDLAKTAVALGGHARWAKSWEDAIAAAKAGAALGIWVEAPVGYPEHAKSEWQKRWERWWWIKQNQPKRTYGHMTSAGWCADHGWQWADPTMDERNPKEQYAAIVTEADILALADSKRVTGKHVAPAFKHVLIVTAPRAAAAPTANEPVQAPTQPVEASKPAPKAPTPPAPRVQREPAKSADPRAELRSVLKQIERMPWGPAKRAAWAHVEALKLQINKEAK
jgi:hypothetical protein